MNRQLGPSTYDWSVYNVGQWARHPTLRVYGFGYFGNRQGGGIGGGLYKSAYTHLQGGDMMDTLATAQQFESATGSVTRVTECSAAIAVGETTGE